ncbi:hypothetical protein AGLY_002623 [Aphis glycines]|uniref:Uncharacterized protein n=1 Tax=Aphis glycines TaxID=307491 RepID=A0A6G0U351_APHGL|nr:hypothetical protein AGLY_002623 [Aphis glycines]
MQNYENLSSESPMSKFSSKLSMGIFKALMVCAVIKFVMAVVYSWGEGGSWGLAVKSKHIPTVFKKIGKNKKKKVTEKWEILRKTSFRPNQFFFIWLDFNACSRNTFAFYLALFISTIKVRNPYISHATVLHGAAPIHRPFTVVDARTSSGRIVVVCTVRGPSPPYSSSQVALHMFI